MIGIILGVVAGLVLPLDSPLVSAAITNVSDFVIHFGRYTLLPLVLFGVSSAVYKLRSTKIIGKTSVWVIVTIIGSSFLISTIGLVSILVVTLPRIPITGEKITELATIDIKSLVMQILPYSSFETLKDGAFLLPAFVFAGFMGGGCTTDEVSSKPVIVFIQSASKLFYSIMSFFVDWLSVGMIAVAAFWMSRTKAVFATGIFNPLTLLLLVVLLDAEYIHAERSGQGCQRTTGSRISRSNKADYKQYADNNREVRARSQIGEHIIALQA